jgi:hypothetical protein
MSGIQVSENEKTVLGHSQALENHWRDHAYQILA